MYNVSFVYMWLPNAVQHFLRKGKFISEEIIPPIGAK